MVYRKDDSKNITEKVKAKIHTYKLVSNIVYIISFKYAVNCGTSGCPYPLRGFFSGLEMNITKNINFYLKVIRSFLLQTFTVYLLHRDDAEEVGGVCADVEGVPPVSVDEAVFHLGVDPGVSVLGPDPTHLGAHQGRLGHTHLIQP